MRLQVKAGHLPQRFAAGGFILNSGIGKLSADEETAAQLHGFAVGAYPFLAKIKPRDFVRLLAASEIALGSAMLLEGSTEQGMRLIIEGHCREGNMPSAA